MRKDSVESIRLLYFAVQRAMQESKKKTRRLKEMTFHQEKQTPPKHHNRT